MDGRIGTPRKHPRSIGWLGTAALAMGGSNQMIFVIAALFAGQGAILGQGSAAVPLLIVGVVLGWMAAPGWLELVLMWPDRVGGIAATCAEAFRPYSPVLANLTGVSYWWGWVPTCGVTALLSAGAIHEWFLPFVPVPILATGIVLGFLALNLSGIRNVTRAIVPIGIASSALAILSGLIPILFKTVDWHQATTFTLTVPFPGWFGQLTSMMAGLYLIGFAAPAFEAATCHVGETVDPNRNVPRAVLAAVAMAGVYFVLLPVVWLGVLGSDKLGKDLWLILGPTYAPMFGGLGRMLGLWFIMLTMFHGTVQPLAGAARVLSQLADDGLLPQAVALRNRHDAPWVASVATAGFAIFFLWLGDPVWLIAAANFTYLIGICLPSVAVWLLRRNEPDRERPYRAPRYTIGLGLAAAAAWGVSAVLGFQQFGLPTVLIGLALAYSGAFLYAWRVVADGIARGKRIGWGSLHVKLTGAMVMVLVLDGAGYLLAVRSVDPGNRELVSVLADIFVAVAMLTVTVGLVLPGMIAHSAEQVSNAARRLSSGTLTDFSRAMEALGSGDLAAAHARVDFQPVTVISNDELGEMAESFNDLQREVARAAQGLAGAREGLSEARGQLVDANEHLEQRVIERTAEVNAHAAALEREVAERKRAQAELAEQEARVRVILDATADGIITVSADGAIRSFNRTAESIYGYRAGEVVGHPCSMLIPASALDSNYFHNHTRDTGSLGGERLVQGRRKSGERVPLAVRFSKTRYGGEDLHVVVVQDISERLAAQEKVANLNRELITAARHAGMAEVANSVLHNVGNVLNSVNVSATLVAEKLQDPRLASLPRVVGLLQEHSSDLAAWLTEDPRGRTTIDYLSRLASYWTAKRATLLDELNALNRNIQHIKDVVGRQQSLSGISGVLEPCELAGLIEETLSLTIPNLDRRSIRIERDLTSLPTLLLDRVKISQILVNLLQNAVDALDEVDDGRDKRICLRTRWNGNGTVRIEVADNGSGISPEHFPRVFTYGFTTKKKGHGFGLHTSALSAGEMGGSLMAASDGLKQGSTFTLALPYRPVNSEGE